MPALLQPTPAPEEPVTETASADAQTTGQVVNSAALNRFFNSASSGAVHQADSSPWGSNVAVTLQKRYAAASGRDCRDIRIDRGSTTQLGIVCRLSASQWEVIRPITRDQNL